MDIFWHKTKIDKWLRVDLWDQITACAVFCGINPDGSINPYEHSELRLIPTTFFAQAMNYKDSSDWSEENQLIAEDVVLRALQIEEDIMHFWYLSKHAEYQIAIDGNVPHEERFFESPKYFIEFFLSKGIEPPWLEYAKEENLVNFLNTDTELEDDTNYVFDEDKYPAELHIAITAYKYALENIKDHPKPKQFILEYLKEKYPKLDANARERIAVIANWNKTGGAPPKNNK